MTFSTSASAQFAPESDPHRGFYIDHFLRFQSGTSELDTSRSILGVDKNFDGIFEKEDAVLQYACENHITYLALYDLHRILGTNKTIWNENTHQFENSEKHLCRFIEKARSLYGVTQIGAIGGSSNYFDSLRTYIDRYPVSAPIHLSDDIKSSPNFNSRLASVETNNYSSPEAQQEGEYLKQCIRILNFNATNACQSDIDVLNIEYEFWGDCSGDFPNFTQIAQSMKVLRDDYNLAHPTNPIITEAYLAFLYFCGSIETQVTQTMDGCNNCSPCSTCANPHEPLIDRILYSMLQSSPYNFSFTEQNYFELPSTQDSTDYHPMFYSESMNNGGGFDFLGLWFTQAPTNTIFFAEEYYFYHWLNLSGSALGQPRQNNVQAGGAHWFASSYMVGHIDHTKMIQTPGPFCSSGDSTLISLDYYGPDEPGTDYTFSITNDADSSIVYPKSGIPITGVSLSTIPAPAYRSINFRDTIAFPKCYLPDGNYTATLNLNYNHSTGCSYTTTTKIIINQQPQIQLVGDSVFCEGNTTFLTAPVGGIYSWFRNGKVIPSANTSTYAANADGDYYCNITGSFCNGNSNIIHITVHPNPTGVVNITCNGNGTYTLKTNLEPANPGSTDLVGPSGVTYLWSSGETTDQIVVTIPTSTQRYYVMITDPYSGCTRLRNAALLAVPNTSLVPSITVNSTPSSSCTSDGSLTAQINSAGAISYFWSNGATTQTISNVPPGIYTVVMTEYANPCSVQATVTLGTSPTTGPTIIPTITNTSCVNKSDGAISLAISGGNPPFSFDWKNIPNENGYNPYSQNLSQLYAGTYTLNLTDMNGCHFTYNYDVAYQHTLPTVTHTATPVSTCGTNNNGSATLTVTNGSSPYSYLWNDITHQTNSIATNLSAGTVSVQITDNNNCVVDHFVNIPTQQISISVSLIDTSVLYTSCNGSNTGRIYLAVSGGIAPYNVNSPWVIDSNFIHLENLSDTTLALEITDSNGCLLQTNYTISSPQTMSVTILSSSILSTTCPGSYDGRIHLTIFGGVEPYTVNLPWIIDSNYIHLENLGDTTLSLEITDNNGCILQNDYTVISPAPLSLTTQSTGTTCITCTNGFIQFTPAGGTAPYTYQWTPTNGNLNGDTIVNLSPGIYSICLIDSNNCSFCAVDTVLEDPTSVSTINGNEAISIFPNPSKGEFTIHSELFTNLEYFVEVKDIEARTTFFSKKLKGNSNQINLDLKAGVYLVVMTVEKRIVFKGRVTVVE